METATAMFVQFVVIERQESIMALQVAMVARDSSDAAFGRITRIHAGEFRSDLSD